VTAPGRPLPITFKQQASTRFTNVITNDAFNVVKKLAFPAKKTTLI
jgi:hypothetical protein